MVSEIHKEVSENLEKLNKKTKTLSVKLLGFVISCWLVIGSFMVGIVAPVYLVKSVMKVHWMGEAQAASGTEKPAVVNPVPVQQQSFYQARITMGQGSYKPIVKQEPQPSLKRNLQQTGDVVTQLRSLASGLRSLASH